MASFARWLLPVQGKDCAGFSPTSRIRQQAKKFGRAKDLFCNENDKPFRAKSAVVQT
jgi:hypothetical protein